jgi:hypothetical protein
MLPTPEAEDGHEEDGEEKSGEGGHDFDEAHDGEVAHTSRRPAMSPRGTPISVATMTAAKPTMSDVRVPIHHAGKEIMPDGVGAHQELTVGN